MKAIKQIVNVLAVLAAILIFALLLIPAPQLFGYRPMVVLSGSMEPTYPVGSITYIKPAAFADINEGDIITFAADDTGTMVTHRVLSKNEDGQFFITQGDATQSPDPNPVFYRNVVGKGHLNIPYIGYAANYLQNLWVYLTLAAILVLKIVLGFFGNQEEPEPETPEHG